MGMKNLVFTLIPIKVIFTYFKFCIFWDIRINQT